MANSDLPGYAPERPLWQPPAVIPSGSVGELARAVQTALAGISGALQQLGGRRNVVPLQGNLDARDGQVIAGVASGQVITLPSPHLGQYGSITVIVTAVSSAATVVSPDGSSYALDQTGVYEFAISPDDTAWRAPPWLSSTGAGFDLATVLQQGNTSGAHNILMDAGQYIGFGDPSLLPAGTNQIRAATDFGIRSEGNVALTSATNIHLRPTSSYLWCNPVGLFYVYTANTARLAIDIDGTWYLGASFDAGSSGEVLTSQGAGSSPIWASVDLSSVTYTAGDGIDLASNVFSADVSDFAGSGLEDDGSNNLRIAAAAAGAGLTGGGGSALAVGAGTGITVNANDVAVTNPLTDGAVGITELALLSSNAGPVWAAYVSFAAAAAGTPDDVTILASVPKNLTVLHVFGRISTAIAGSTVTVRTASGGGGSAFTNAISTATAGFVQSNATQEHTAAAGSALFLRRSDRGVAGAVVILCVRS